MHQVVLCGRRGVAGSSPADHERVYGGPARVGDAHCPLPGRSGGGPASPERPGRKP